MGRRAKKQAVATKKKVKLAKRFKCPFCSNDDVVECKMDFKLSIGSLLCRICGAAYQMPIHHLHEPIDVFSEWLDDCEAAANPRASNSNAGSGAPQYEDEVDDLVDNEEEDDDLPEGSGLGTASSSQRSQSTGKNNNNNNNDSRKPAAASSKASASRKSVDLGLSSDEEDDDDE